MSTLKALNSISDTLITAQGSMDKRIAAHLVAIAKHVNGAGNGDTSAVNYFWTKLTTGKTSGIRADAVGNWLLAYCGVTWNAEKKRYGRKKDFTFSEQLATENPWYKFTKQAEFKPFDLEKALASLIKKANAALEDSEHAKEHKVPKHILKALENLKEGNLKTTTIEVQPGDGGTIVAPAPKAEEVKEEITVGEA